ncbi:unnamed protein product, partial [marine sediment metagenome]
TGHANLSRNLHEYLDRIGPRIRHFHLQDNDGQADIHLGPFAGRIDWEQLVVRLKDFNGPFVMEFPVFDYPQGMHFLFDRLR